MELRPQWKDIICVVMTQGNQDPVEWNDIIGSAARKEELARQFKDNNSPLKIAIVVDMWLTGFDVPSLATMYVYKPMKGHNLMQAIARVNRVFPEKSGGLVVDYIGIAKALKRPCTTIQDVTRKLRRPEHQDNRLSTVRRRTQALPGMYERLRLFLFSDCSNLQRANLIRGGVNVLLDKDNLVSSEPTTQTDEMVTLFLWMPFLPRREKSLWKKANACHRLLRFAAVCSPLQNVLKKHI